MIGATTGATTGATIGAATRGRGARALLALLAPLAAVAAGGGCVSVKGTTSPGGQDASAPAEDALPTIDRGQPPPPPGKDAAPADDASCTPVSCTPYGGQYCGMIGDGCVSTKDCGACPGDQVCHLGLCIGGPSCVPATACSAGSAHYCGDIGNGCGGKLSCGGCASSTDTCNGGLCVPVNCTRLACSVPGGVSYCGKIGDGCGGTLDCTCTAPFTCGGGGIDGVCGAPAASCPTLVSCAQTSGSYCGQIGNGCGGLIDCGATCPSGMACATTGSLANVCPSATVGCTNLQCQIKKDCAGGAKTTISGTIYDPAGKNPLYDVLVYVPNAAVDPIGPGVTCDSCDSPISGQPVAAALTDAHGVFHMPDAPAGANIPLVIQIGKWRRQITLPQVTACQDNVFNDPATMRLPRTQSEGHMPLIALSTGHSDALDCLLRKIGIADSEFSIDTGGGRVHMYAGAAGVVASDHGTGATQLASGVKFPDAYSTLLASASKLANYDILVLQCEGQSPDVTKYPYQPNLRRYADNGGRIFADHVHSIWIRKGLPPWPATGDWIGSGPDLPSPTTATVDTSFPKGIALADWLVTVGASTTRTQFPIVMGQNSVNAVYSPTQPWITAANTSGGTATQYLTFNTPLEVPPAGQCGRVVFTDVHVSSPGDSSHSDVPFPMGCTAVDMTPQEKALEFMFFDLSSCVQLDTGAPMIPKLPPPGIPNMPPGVISVPPAPPPPPPPPPPPIVQ